MTGPPEQRVEALRQWLGYPIKQRDPEKNLFWYLRPGDDDDDASETRPVAVGFYSELNEGSDSAIKAWVASKGNAVSQHFFDWSDFTNQPVMYLLLPEAQQAGRIALVLPAESRQWRQRQVLTYEWDSAALLTPLKQLKHVELKLMKKVENRPMFSVPLVEWVFYTPIATAKELAQELARISRDMEQIIAAYKESTLNEYLRNLFNSFKRELLPNLKVSSTNQKDYSFADIYAQTIAYGLFTARVFSHVRNPREDFNRQDAWDKLPETNPFLRQLFQGISEQSVEALGDDLANKISEVFNILRATKMDSILSNFRQKMNQEDIVIRFYEDFLKAYKPEMRERRGVYYTPEPVVSYMVRSVDILLKEKFDKPLGLADPEVMILDPACGTGTFLLYIFQEIRKKFLEKPEALTEGLEDKSWSGYVQERLLPRVFGFELLMAPYAIAHLKLGLFLEETGYSFYSGLRLGVYLTNSLEAAKRKSEELFKEFIANEADEASEIKLKKPISVVIGNPPYSALSANLGEEVRRIVDPYRYVDGEKIVEKGALQFEKNIQDDYVKFFAFSQALIKKAEKGIICLITNHGLLDSLTLRGLRNSLFRQFKTIYAFDLRGSVKRKAGVKDENIFDIQQGVAISVCVNTLELNSEESHDTEVKRSDLLGSRDEKYTFLSSNSIDSIDWKLVKPVHPYFIFAEQNEISRREYLKYTSLSDAMPENSSGTETGIDSLMISFDENELRRKINEFLDKDSSQEYLKKSFGIKGGTGGKLMGMRESFRNDFMSNLWILIRKKEPLKSIWVYMNEARKQPFLNRLS